MQINTSGLDPAQLARFIDDAYGLDGVSLAFQPKGEASYSYIATEASGGRWVIKAQEPARAAGLEARLSAVRYAAAEGGMTEVVTPRLNRTGSCTSPYARYVISVYPFVDGETIEPARQTDAYAVGLASLLAGFHRQGNRLPFSIPREDFNHPFEAPIRQALQTVAAPGRLANPVQERLRDLLLAQRANVLATLAAMRQTTEEVRRLDLDWVLTHGDPNWSNILVTPAGEFRLLDWEDVALGPPERDLVFFSDRRTERFELFLRQYLAIGGPTRLHPAVFAFYAYRWTLQEIADYTTAILFRNVDPAEDEHSWAELQPYLPADLAGIAAFRRQMEATLARVNQR